VTALGREADLDPMVLFPVADRGSADRPLATDAGVGSAMGELGAGVTATLDREASALWVSGVRT
jgi:hypothetical protein